MSTEVIQQLWNGVGGTTAWESATTQEARLIFLEAFARLVASNCLDAILPHALRFETFDGNSPVVRIRERFGVQE
jgi:hypothetical protein